MYIHTTVHTYIHTTVHTYIHTTVRTYIHTYDVFRRSEYDVQGMLHADAQMHVCITVLRDSVLEYRCNRMSSARY